MDARTILILEDYPLTRKMLRIALEAEGFRVIEAATAGEALALAEKRLPNLVLQDLGLPDMDGFELLHRLRRLPGGSQLPIIACTGRATSMDELRTVQAGFNDFLMKPVEPSRLIEVVRAHLRGPIKELRNLGRGRRILLVEDDMLQRMLARRRLEEMGFQVELAEDGMDGLEKARAFPPHAILTDVLMPRLDGFQLCLCVRRDPQLSSIPVLLHSTAYVTAEDTDLAQRIGAYMLISRTPNWLDLGPVLVQAIEQGAPALTQDLDLSVDSAYFQRVVRQLEAQAAANLTLARRCTRQATHLALLRAVADTLRSSERATLPINDVLLHCLDAAGISRGIILQETSAGPFRIMASSGVSGQSAGTIAAAFEHNALFRRACEKGQVLPLSIGSASDEEGRELLVKSGSGSALLVPIRTEPGQTAVLWLMSSSTDLGDADWLDFARGLGDQLGQALMLGRAFAQVTASEERYRQLVEGIEGIIWEADAITGRFTYVSPFAETLLGYPVQSWLSNPDFWEQRVVPDDRALPLQKTFHSHSQQRTYSAEYRVVAADGRIVWLHDSIRILPEQDGGVAHLRGMMVDITDRKRIEEERAERMKLAAFTAEVTSALANAGPLNEVLRICCEAMARHLDAGLARVWTHEDATAMLHLRASAGPIHSIDDRFYHVPVGQTLIGWIAKTRQPLVTNDAEHEPRVFDASWITDEKIVALAAYPLLVEDRLVGVLAMLSRKPISSFVSKAMTAAAATIAVGIEQRRNEERLMEHRRRLDTLTQVAPLAVYAARLHDSIHLTWISDSSERITGFPPSRFIGDPEIMRQRTHLEDRAAMAQAMAQLATSGSTTFEFRFLCADEKYRTFLSQATLVKGTTGSAQEVMGSWLDVTPLREAEEALRERDEQLRQAQKMESIGRLAGGIAHDFNNLLSVILGYSSLTLLELSPSDSSYSYLSEINAAGQRAAALTRQLLAFSRKQVLEPRIVDVAEVVAGMQQLLHRLIGEDIQLVIDKVGTLSSVRADPGQLEQVVLNLAVNARDAMPRGGTLTLRTEDISLKNPQAAMGAEVPAGRYVAFTVIDTGCGMSEAVRSRLFEPFFTTKEAGKGTGLGLSSVYGIVRQSGGYIRVESVVDKGSTFQILLPALEEPFQVPEAAAGAPASRPPTETLLLVEDEEAVRHLSSKLLRSHGYQVLEAADGPEALQLCQRVEQPIHLLLTDVVMPKMNGRELAESMRQLWPSLRTLYVSGYTDDLEVLRSIRQEQVRFLQKPFTPDALLAHVREALDGPAPAEGSR